MKTIFKQIVFIAFLSLLYLNSGFSQESNKTTDVLGLRKNAFYGGFGFGVMEMSISGYYERIIGKGIASTSTETFIRVGRIGVEGYRSKDILSLDGGLLLGSRLPHITEIAAGWHPNLGDTSDYIPIGGSVAYRYQRPQGRFIFRLGVGYPESIFISLGFCF
jgi:hypothetical protein